MFLNLNIRPRQEINTTAWDIITNGLAGRASINDENMPLAGNWGNRRALIGFGIDSGNLTVRMPDAKVAGVA